MSKGPGSVESQLSEIFTENRKQAFQTSELCRKIFRIKRVEKKHRVSVLRALKRMSTRSTAGVERAVKVGRVVVKGKREDWWFDYDQASPRPQRGLRFALATEKRPQKPAPQKYRHPWK